MDFIVRFTQSHETFRLPELQALAELEGVGLIIKHYSTEVLSYYLPSTPFHPPSLPPRLLARSHSISSYNRY